MPRTHPPYSPEFRRQMVDLVRAGRDPDDLAREFDPTGHSIRAWVAQANRNEGRRAELTPGLATAERDELIRLRRENKQLRELEHRPLIRTQAFGEAVDPNRLERLSRYETHLDRKLERMLAMLFKLQELRRAANPT